MSISKNARRRNKKMKSGSRPFSVKVAVQESNQGNSYARYLLKTTNEERDVFCRKRGLVLGKFIIFPFLAIFMCRIMFIISQPNAFSVGITLSIITVVVSVMLFCNVYKFKARDIHIKAANCYAERTALESAQERIEWFAECGNAVYLTITATWLYCLAPLNIWAVMGIWIMAMLAFSMDVCIAFIQFICLSISAIFFLIRGKGALNLLGSK